MPANGAAKSSRSRPPRSEMQTTVQVATPVIPQRLQYRSPRTRAAGIAACLPPKSSTLHDVDPVDTLQRVAVVLYQHLLRCERDKAGLAPLPPVHRAAAALPQVPDLTLPPLDISGDVTVPAGGGAALPAVAEAAESLPQPGTSVPAGVNIGVARVASAVDLSAADRSLLFAPQWSREPVSTLDSTAQGSVSTSIRTRDGQPILEAPPRVPGSSTPRLDASPAVGSLPAFALPSPTLSAFSPALGPTGAGQSKGAEEEDESHHFHEAQFLRPQFDLSFYRGPVVHIPSFFTIRTMEPAFTLPTVTDIFTFAHYVYGTARLSPECSVVCLIYVERLLSNGNVLLLASNWRPIVLTALLLASKMWNDLATWNVELAAVCRQYSQGAISRMEQAFVSCLRFQLYITASTYAKYFFALRGLSEQRDFQRRFAATLPVEVPGSSTPPPSASGAGGEVEAASAALQEAVYSRSL